MGQVCLIPATGTRNLRFWAGRGVPRPPQSRRVVVILTFIPASGRLPTMTSLLHAGSGRLSAYADGADRKAISYQLMVLRSWLKAAVV